MKIIIKGYTVQCDQHKGTPLLSASSYVLVLLPLLPVLILLLWATVQSFNGHK